MTRDELDRILDEALESYAGAEPRPGLPDRVLARVRADVPPRGLGWWVWAVVIPVAAAIALGIVTFPGKSHKAAILPTVSQQVSAALPPPAVLPRAHHRAAHRNPAPRQNQFPAAVVLSGDERALLDFARRFPDQARAAFVGANAPIQLLDIEPIQIPPLTGGEP